MSYKFVFTSALFVLFSAGNSALAQVPKASTTTQAFVTQCGMTKDVAAQNFCHGFSQGVYETYLITRHPKHAPAFICAERSNKTRQDYINGFIQWSVAHPKFDQMSAADTILRYLAEIMPCKKG